MNNWTGDGIYIQREMQAYRANPLDDMALSSTAPIPSACKQSKAERDVLKLFDELRDPTLRYVCSLGLSIHDGEEITQDVFLALLRHLQLDKPRDNLRAWVFKVAHNLALKRRRAIWKDFESSESSASADAQLDTAWNPEEQLSATERQKRLLTIFCALPEKDRFCVKLRAEGLRYREIAAVLEMSLGAVANSLARALSRMIERDGM